MSNEQNGPGIDPLVSDTYRELADEKTPDALNRKVLRMAEREARTPYAIARAWTRPVAWAATIGLSLVLVLQLADVPELTDLPAAAPAPVAPHAEADSVELPRDDAAAPGARASTPPSPAATDVADPQPTVPEVAKRSRTEIRPEQKVSVMQDEPVPAPIEREAAAEEAPPGRSYVSRDIVQEAREEARTKEAFQREQIEEAAVRQRGGGEQAEAAAGLAVSQSMASFSQAAEAGDFLCPPSARKTPEQWLECIASIEETTPPELVDSEYEALHERFPEFERVSR